MNYFVDISKTAKKDIRKLKKAGDIQALDKLDELLAELEKDLFGEEI